MGISGCWMKTVNQPAIEERPTFSNARSAVLLHSSHICRRFGSGSRPTEKENSKQWKTEKTAGKSGRSENWKPINEHGTKASPRGVPRKILPYFSCALSPSSPLGCGVALAAFVDRLDPFPPMTMRLVLVLTPSRTVDLRSCMRIRCCKMRAFDTDNFFRQHFLSSNSLI